MIKTFEQFINENYNEMPVLAYGEEYGTPLFNEISESMVSEIHKGINEGRIVLNASILEEGLFDTIGKIFKKGTDAAAQKAEEKGAEINSLSDTISSNLDKIRDGGIASAPKP